MAQIPTVIGLMVCEKTIIEERTKNVTLVNCLTRLIVDGFPSQPRGFTVFAVLSSGLGDIRLEVVISRLTDDVTVYQEVRQVQFRDMLQEVRFILHITTCKFPSAGKYQIDLLADGHYVAHHRIDVSEKDV